MATAAQDGPSNTYEKENTSDGENKRGADGRVCAASCALNKRKKPIARAMPPNASVKNRVDFLMRTFLSSFFLISLILWRDWL